MYAKDDIRSTLQATAPRAAVDPATPIRQAQLIEFPSHMPADVASQGSRTWLARSQNAVLAYTEVRAGDVFRRVDQPDEYTVLMYSESARVRVSTPDAEQIVDEEAFVVVPPGDSAVEALSDGVLVRLFSAQAEDLCRAAINADAYRDADPRVALTVPGPDPVDGFRIRVYPLAQWPLSDDRFGRIFRTTNVMVNFVPEEHGPRNPRKLSPHFHDDFEQLSLAVKGSFVHHIRYPWGPDSEQWRDDENLPTESPSVCIIPPPTVHTTRGLGPLQQLLDIFAPPREDFAASGWVLNADDYPVG
jgi:hypothetical protein